MPTQASALTDTLPPTLAPLLLPTSILPQALNQEIIPKQRQAAPFPRMAQG